MAIRIDDFSVKEAKATQSPSAAPSISKEAWWNRDIQLLRSRFGLKRREAFYAELTVLLSAGLDMQKALRLIENNQKQKQNRAIITNIRNAIIEGASLSAAMQRSGHFSDYEIFSIQIGEESGQLIKVLNELLDFYGKSIKYRQQLMSALAYPIFVIGFAGMVIYFLLHFLVPMFKDVYARFDGELPLITQQIVALSDWVGAYGGYVFLALVLIGLGMYSQRRQPWLRRWTAAVVLRMPIFGGIIRRIYLSRVCQSMYLLMQARIPLLQAVELVAKMVGFYPVERSLQKAAGQILQGKPLHESLSSSRFYPDAFIALLQVGEESGSLDKMFYKLGQQYSTETEQRTATIGSLLEPVLIIFLGVLVGVILVAMYLPLFQMSVGVG